MLIYLGLNGFLLLRDRAADKFSLLLFLALRNADKFSLLLILALRNADKFSFLLLFIVLWVTIPIPLSLRIGGLDDLFIQRTRLEILQAWKILTLSWMTHSIPSKSKIHSIPSKSTYYFNGIRRESTLLTQLEFNRRNSWCSNWTECEDVAWRNIIDTVGIQPTQQLVLELDGVRRRET